MRTVKERACAIVTSWLRCRSGNWGDATRKENQNVLDDRFKVVMESV